jgi:hypothetical protein
MLVVIFSSARRWQGKKAVLASVSAVVMAAVSCWFCCGNWLVFGRAI